MCVCDSGVSVCYRDAEAGVTVVNRIVAVRGASRCVRSLFWSFSIVTLSRHLGLRWLRRMLLCLSSGRSGQGRNCVSGPQAASGVTDAAIDGGISTVANER